MSVRQATASDIDAITEILIRCFADDPCYSYRFPLTHRYAQEYTDHCNKKCLEYLETSTVIVCEVTDQLRAEKAVAGFAVWGQPHAGRSKGGRSQTWPRLSPAAFSVDDKMETNYTPTEEGHAPHTTPQVPSQPPYARADRSKAFRDSCKAAKTRFFDKQYTDGYMFLKLLLVHPSYRRQGAGMALVKWGTSRACIDGVNTALFSSPMGSKLYQKLGFKETGRFQVRLEGEDEGLDIPAMVLVPPIPIKSRRGSRCSVEAAGVGNGLRKVVTNYGMVAQKA
jgi:ribosomal protein S18 acetylase RimI-like enzyme